MCIYGWVVGGKRVTKKVAITERGGRVVDGREKKTCTKILLRADVFFSHRLEIRELIP